MSSVITTDFERWKAQEAALGKPVALNEFVFANVPGLDPSKDISRDEKLPPAGQIVHRQAVNKAGLASENAVAYSVTLGTDVGDFVFNWIGLINKESGTLAMITHAPEQRKIKTVDGVQGNVLTRSFLLEFNGAATETQITASAETWQIDFTARLAGMDEIQRLANRDIYGAAAFFGDGFLVTKAAEQYRVTPGAAYIEGLRGTLEEITAFNNLRDTKIYVDFTFQGNLVSKWQTFVKVTTAKTLAHYQDAAGFQHYVAVIAEIDQNGNITDKRVKGTAIDRELAELKKDIPEKYQPKGDYQPAGSYVTTANFSLELNKKIDKASISDQMGTASDKVPSLRLLSEQIGKCQPKGDYASDIDVSKKMDIGYLGWGGIGKEYSPAYADYISDLKNAETTTRVIRNDNVTSDVHYRYGTVAYFRSRETFMAVTAAYDGEGIRFIAGNATAMNIYNVITHRNVSQNTGSSEKNVMSENAVSERLFGIGQTWQNVTASRAVNTIYRNTGKKTITISVTKLGRSGTILYINNEPVTSVDYGDGNLQGSLCMPVPPGAEYKITVYSGTIQSWWELR